MSASVCVVHLVWAPLGLEPFRNFLASYRRFPGGVAHRLLIVYNGFAPGADRASYQRELAEIVHEEMVLPEPEQDIAAYFLAAAAVTETNVCFLNSYCVLLDPLWLQKLCAGLARPKMGAVGATGSAQSHVTYLRSIGWGQPSRYWLRRRYLYLRYLFEVLRLWSRFPVFPNYHLRTNAFLIGRERFLASRRPIRDKLTAERFESSRRGLTARLRARGLAVGVVGQDGVCYPPERWARSHTFRGGAQENLLVADNRTLEYALADPAAQRRMAAMAWGPAV